MFTKKVEPFELLNIPMLSIFFNTPYAFKFAAKTFQTFLEWNQAFIFVFQQGSIAVAGGLVKWLRDNLGIINESKDIGRTVVYDDS